MRDTIRCPKCEHRKIWVVEQVAIPHGEGTQRLPVAAIELDTDQDGKNETYFAGAFAAHICAACGYTEFYAERVDKLAELAKYTDKVRLRDASPQHEYR